MLDGNEIYETELKLSHLLNIISEPKNPDLINKLKEARSSLLKLGIQLPNAEPHDDKLNIPEVTKKLMAKTLPTGKSYVKDIMSKITAERKQLKSEIEFLEKDLKLCREDLAQSETKYNDSCQKLIENKSEFENLIEKYKEPIENIHISYENLSQGGTVLQLLAVMKTNLPKLRELFRQQFMH